MFRSLMTIIRELYLYLTEVIFMLKHSVKLRHIYLVMWQRVVELHVPLYDMMPINSVHLSFITRFGKRFYFIFPSFSSRMTVD